MPYETTNAPIPATAPFKRDALAFLLEAVCAAVAAHYARHGIAADVVLSYTSTNGARVSFLVGGGL